MTNATPLQRALGDRFDDLHPRIRDQYALHSSHAHAWTGRGVMEEIWRGRLMGPFLRIGARRRVMFPERGRNVPFTIENYAYVDGFGRETLTWTRRFELDRPRRFDETIIYSEKRGRAIVYAGTHQHVGVELEAAADNGALVLRTGTQRFYEWRLGFRFPLLFSGRATVVERYNDELERFEVDVSIANPVWGRIFGYRGWFTLQRRSCENVPADVKPVREECRE